MSVTLHRALVSIMAATLLFFAAEVAEAEEPMRPFGARGEVAIDDLVAVRTSGIGFLGVVGPVSGSFGPVGPPAISGLLGYDRATAELPPNGETTITINSIAVAPSLDVFVANRFSIGLTVGFAYSWGGVRYPAEQGGLFEEGRAITFGVAPRIGYVVPLGHGFSLWPRAGAGFSFSRADTLNVVPGKAPYVTSITGGIRWTGGVDLGVVFRPTRRLFFTATPELSVAHTANGQDISGTTVYLAQSLRVRFAGTLGFGVLLGG